jgi:hypothetical protein
LVKNRADAVVGKPIWAERSSMSKPSLRTRRSIVSTTRMAAEKGANTTYEIVWTKNWLTTLVTVPP